MENYFDFTKKDFASFYLLLSQSETLFLEFKVLKSSIVYQKNKSYSTVGKQALF